MSDPKLILPAYYENFNEDGKLAEACQTINGMHAMPAPLAIKLAKTLATCITALWNSELTENQMKSVMQDAGAWSSDRDVRAWVGMIMRINEGRKL